MRTNLGVVVVMSGIALAAVEAPARAQLRPFLSGDTSGERYAGVELGVGSMGSGQLDVTVATLDVVGNMPVWRGVDAFIRMPLVWEDIETGIPELNDSASGLGNLTLGGRVRYQTIGKEEAIYRVAGFASVSLPTASDGEDRVMGPSIFNMPRDFGFYLPDTTTVRLGGDVALFQKSFFLQLEVVVALMYIDVDSPTWNGAPVDRFTLLHPRATVGLMLAGDTAAIVELDVMSTMFDEDAEAFFDDGAVESLDLGIRWQTQRISATGRLYFPLDEELRDDLEALGLGIDVAARF